MSDDPKDYVVFERARYEELLDNLTSTQQARFGRAVWVQSVPIVLTRTNYSTYSSWAQRQEATIEDVADALTTSKTLRSWPDDVVEVIVVRRFDVLLGPIEVVPNNSPAPTHVVAVTPTEPARQLVPEDVDDDWLDQP